MFQANDVPCDCSFNNNTACHVTHMSKGTCVTWLIQGLAHVALLCTNLTASATPPMSSVVSMLEGKASVD
ncbi:hypothetical protein V6N13_147527 [Hibiscus sabdariffa]